MLVKDQICDPTLTSDSDWLSIGSAILKLIFGSQKASVLG